MPKRAFFVENVTILPGTDNIGSADNPLAESLLDRIKYDAYKINIRAVDENHDRSMRELYGLKPEESQ
jgi:hypothetical protein